MRNPPFESVFTETRFDNSRPEVTFRVQDISKSLTPAAFRTAISREDVEIKQAATYGKSKKGRGPLKWFLEEEIEAARNLIAKEKEYEYKEKKKKDKKKAKSKRYSKKRNKSSTNSNNVLNIEKIKLNDSEENKARNY